MINYTFCLDQLFSAHSRLLSVQEEQKHLVERDPERENRGEGEKREFGARGQGGGERERVWVRGVLKE